MKKIGMIIFILALFVGGALVFPVNTPHVQLPAEKIGAIAGISITNTITSAWATIIILSLLFFFGTRNMRVVPGRFQGFLESIIEILLGLCESVAGKEKGRKFFTLVATLFLFIVISNWMELVPGYDLGYGSLGIWASGAGGERTLVPLFRATTTDLNTTIALALISVIATQAFGINRVGFGSYARRFINFKSPIDFFVGVLESISEFAKIISFSFRLFGNIFAGDVLLGVMTFLIPWVAVVPFMGLEFFFGVIQAFIFFMLTLVFMTIATAEHGAEHSAEPSTAH